MRAGLLREQIVIQSRADSVNSYGQPVAAWSAFATVWAAIEPGRGREYFDAQGLQVVEPMRFRIRWLSGMTTLHRILYDGKTFDIDYVEDFLARDREMHIYASTGLTQG
jgi:SPP1 family predicted phage head-tail adaptor